MTTTVKKLDEGGFAIATNAPDVDTFLGEMEADGTWSGARALEPGELAELVRDVVTTALNLKLRGATLSGGG